MLNSQKHLFQLRPDIHYLNCAYKAPLLSAAEEAGIADMQRGRNPIDIGMDQFFGNSEIIKKQFARIVKCHEDSIALIPSTSYGFSTALNNWPGKLNGKTITVADEFPSGYYSLESWCKKQLNELVVVQPNKNDKLPGKSWNENLLRAIDKNTSVVLLSSVHWMNGVKFDLKAIGEKCQAVGAMFIVDGTQSVGAVPIDLEELHIDVLICASYKWLFGPYSLALAYFGEKLENGTPLEEAWMNRTNAKDFSNLTKYDSQVNAKAGRYNVGEHSNFILAPMMIESLKQIIEWQPKRIIDYCDRLIQPLKTFLEQNDVALETPDYFSPHLFSLPFPTWVKQDRFKEQLVEKKISVSFRGDSIRVAPHVYNEAKDIEALIAALEESR